MLYSQGKGEIVTDFKEEESAQQRKAVNSFKVVRS